jgi:hypothetical protein
MKNRVLNMLFLLTLISGMCFGQNQVSSDFNTNYLTGTWKNITPLRNSNGNLIYEKTSNLNKNITGFLLKFESNGKMISQFKSNAKRKCGNDLSGIPRKGKWNFNKDIGILETTIQNRISGGIPIIQSYKILELTNDRLIMERILE